MRLPTSLFLPPSHPTSRIHTPHLTPSSTALLLTTSVPRGFAPPRTFTTADVTTRRAVRLLLSLLLSPSLARSIRRTRVVAKSTRLGQVHSYRRKTPTCRKGCRPCSERRGGKGRQVVPGEGRSIDTHGRRFRWKRTMLSISRGSGNGSGFERDEEPGSKGNTTWVGKETEGKR